jgi:hypothetical protein
MKFNAARRKTAKKRNKQKPADADTTFKHQGFFGLADFDDEDDDPAPSGSRPKKKCKKPSIQNPTPSSASAASSSAAPSGSGLGSGAAVELGESFVPHDEDGDDEGLGQKRGAPRKNALEMEAKFWADMASADEHSVYFCKMSDVQRRLVVRWANTARTKVASSCDAETKRKFEGAAKRLQIIEAIIALHRKWMLRSGDMGRAYAEFDSGFKVLQSFADSEPSQPLQCKFLWDLRLQLQACGMLHL